MSEQTLDDLLRQHPDTAGRGRATGLGHTVRGYIAEQPFRTLPS
jgi:hypothetical protein